MNLRKLNCHKKGRLRDSPKECARGTNKGLPKQIDNLQSARKHFGIAYDEMAPNQQFIESNLIESDGSKRNFRATTRALTIRLNDKEPHLEETE